jgi:hypothetical protein
MASFNGIIVASGLSVNEVYQQLRELFADGSSKLLIATYVTNPTMQLPEGCKMSVAEIQEATDNLLLEENDRDYMFNHWSRFTHFPGTGKETVNQWARAVSVLASPGAPSPDGVLVVTHPELDFESGRGRMVMPAPYFCMAQFTIDSDNRLGITAVYRRQEMSQWWVVNAWELVRYRDLMLTTLKKDRDVTLLPGPINTLAVSAWWAGEDKKLSIVDRSAFDEPNMRTAIAVLIARLFEDQSRDAAKELADLVSEKARNVSSSHAPCLGAEVVDDVLEVMKKRYIDKNRELYEELHQQITRIKELSDVLRTESASHGVADALRHKYEGLSNYLRTFAQANGMH